MKRVGVSEFRRHTSKYVLEGEALAIEQDGQTVGFYIPAVASRKKKNAAESLKRLEETVQRVMAETGLSEEELSQLFDLNQPLPDLPLRHRPAPVADVYATGG